MKIKILKSIAAFTLVEIIIVIVIIGIIASLAIPRLLDTVERARANEAQNMLLSLFGSQKRYEIDNDSYTNNINNLDVTIPTPMHFNDPTVSDGSGIGEILATIQRSNGLYELTIDVRGDITCTDLTAATVCARFGL